MELAKGYAFRIFLHAKRNGTEKWTCGKTGSMVPVEIQYPTRVNVRRRVMPVPLGGMFAELNKETWKILLKK
jgi:hypothetical protein